LEKIGEFSKRCEVTIKTLRYYDEIGLLAPDYIDNLTGYRYYGPGKVIEMQRITELKDIGFTLDEIKKYCDMKNDDEKNQIIKEKHWALMKAAENTALQLKRLEAIRTNLQKQRGEKQMSININTPFENDERVIGRWEFIATVDKKEDFKPGNKYGNETIYEELYFLPDGGEYWGFSWTKGYIKILFGAGLIVPYELDEVDGQIFMFVDYPYYGGTWVLKQTDKERHTKYSIAINDNIDLPFVDDPQVHGKWTSVDFVGEIAKFNPDKRHWRETLFFKSAEFLPDGQVKKQFEGRDGTWDCRWTKGTTLAKSGETSTAPAYEIHNIGGTDYLFLEWKSGDYIWGKRKPSYYVFKRA
jgi:DNA-binding transcriptional MerR regulator